MQFGITKSKIVFTFIFKRYFDLIFLQIDNNLERRKLILYILRELIKNVQHVSCAIESSSKLQNLQATREMISRHDIFYREITKYTSSNALTSNESPCVPRRCRWWASLFAKCDEKWTNGRARIVATIPYRVSKDHSGIKADPYSSTRRAYSPLS